MRTTQFGLKNLINEGSKLWATMNFNSFKFILRKIEKDFAAIELDRGGLKPISAAERLTLTMLFSHWGNVLLPIFPISDIKGSNIVHHAGSMQGNHKQSRSYVLKGNEYGERMDSVC